MPRISLWSPNKGTDFNYIDKAVGEGFSISGDCVLVHMYVGPTTDHNGNTDTSLTTIQDVLFMANVNRKYDNNVIELRGHHTPQDVNYDLTQFGIFLSSDMIRIQFHYNDMIRSLGRKLISGDVLEFPSMKDVPIFDNAVGINRYYVVEDALYAAAGYGPKWFPHIWLVRAKLISASPEFKEITDDAAFGQTQGNVGQGIGLMPEGSASTANSDGNPGNTCNPNITNSLNLFCKILSLSDAMVEEAERNAFFDPKFFESNNLYIYLDDNGYPVLGSSNYYGADGRPPNGLPLKGAGVQFPPDLQDGDYYLRLDYFPERLFQKQGNVYKFIEQDMLKIWTSYNRVLDTFIDNVNDTVFQDGTVVSEKQPVSKVLTQKVDLYAERKQTVKDAEIARKLIADTRAAQRGY